MHFCYLMYMYAKGLEYLPQSFTGGFQSMKNGIENLQICKPPCSSELKQLNHACCTALYLFLFLSLSLSQLRRSCVHCKALNPGEGWVEFHPHFSAWRGNMQDFIPLNFYNLCRAV